MQPRSLPWICLSAKMFSENVPAGDNSSDDGHLSLLPVAQDRILLCKRRALISSDKLWHSFSREELCDLDLVRRSVGIAGSRK